MKTHFQQLLLALSMTIVAVPALATLGGAVTKEAKQIQVQNSVVSAQPTLNVFQFSLPSGTEVKEYTDSNGVVVAVSWQGPAMPNLEQLLGAHFQTFINRPTNSNQSHRRVVMNTPELVAQVHGHVGAFKGVVYNPSALPAGFNTQSIQ